MATQICSSSNNNNNNGVGQKSKGFNFQSFFLGIKTAFITKLVKGIKIINERKSESCSSRKDDELKKRMVDDYEGLSFIGEGGDGVVYKVREKETGIIMAMKEKCDGLSPATRMEIDILKSLDSHPSIVDFKGVARDEYGGVYLVMEYVETDLKSYIALKKKEGFAINEVKKLMKQLLEGVKFLHENGVMHRDLKPENILVSKGGDLKICDFGTAIRFGEAKASYSPYVGTMWYRAPELFFGRTEYSSEVDMWSVGCIMGELLLNKVLFTGEDREEQLNEIYSLLGDPENDNKINSSISSANLVLTEDGIDLLKGLLSYDTSKRMTAESALNHVWFHHED